MGFLNTKDCCILATSDEHAAEHGMPEVITDAVNEALFDEIGDTALECEGGSIRLVEDYREDVARLVGGME